ncbi:MAG: 16S rRNA (cytosine(967)-C(5))-methyltransferase RsmB [Pseudomonas sp.]
MGDIAAQAGVASRLAAARVLVAVMARGRSLKAELATVLPTLSDPRDRALVEAICLGVLRRHPAYRAALAGWLQRPLGHRDADLQALLMVGFAQIEVLRLPPHAALSATVEACRALGRPRQAGMVNAILRRALRDGVPEVPADAAWPDWLRRQVRADWGVRAEAVFVASAQPAPMWLRVNRRHGDPEQYVMALAAAGLSGQTVGLLPDAVRLDAPTAVAQLPGFEAGRVSVQDGSAQQVADALVLTAGARVLDACAAPGGKSAHLLEREPSLRLTALDVDTRRLQRVGETLARTCPDAVATLRTADATDPAAWWDGQPFDAVLLDAPCSATGIVRRQPDVLLHRRAEDVAALVVLQARLLDALWGTLRPGGHLLYTTCSILARENHEQVQAFLARTRDASVRALPEVFGHVSGAGRQRLPGEEGCDGFFYASLVKNT